MLLTLLICVALLLAIGSIFVYKRVLNPVFIILIWYITGIVISHSGLFGMYKPASGSSEFILTNIIILCCAFYIVSKTKSLRPLRINARISEKTLDKFFSILRILSFLIQVVISIHLVILISTGAINIASIRQIAYSLAYGSNDYTLIFFNQTIYYIFNLIIKGFILFDVSWSFCESLDNSKKIRYISLINLFLYCFIMLSRIEILRIIIIFVLAFITHRYYRIKIKTDKKVKKIKINKGIVIIFGIAIFIVFSFRTSTGVSVVGNSIEDVIVDLTGSYVVFGNFFTDYFNGLRLIDSNVIAMLFGGLESALYILLKPFGINIDLPTSALNEYISIGTNIGASNHFNAFYTMYYNFLASGGVVGCVVVSIFLGILLGVLYKHYFKNPTSESLLLYIFGLHIIIFGSIRWELGTFSLWFMLILIILLKTKKSNL
ncbi:MAG: O-antigen polymerase [Acetobacterium sp.]